MATFAPEEGTHVATLYVEFKEMNKEIATEDDSDLDEKGDRVIAST